MPPFLLVLSLVLVSPVPAGAGARAACGARPAHATACGQLPRGDALAARGWNATGGDTSRLASSVASAAARSADDSTVARKARRPRRPEYLGEVLRQRDSVVERWADRRRNPIHVWIEPAPKKRLAGWNADFPSSVRSAFGVWEGVGLPVHFVFVDDSTAADVQVKWLAHFETDESGRTVWWTNSRSLITQAEITLATHASDGGPQDPRSLRAVALHEIGHLLGLDHSNDSANVMAPWVQVADLSDADRATARMLYALPPGRVKH